MKKSLKSTDYSPGALRKQNVKIHDPVVKVSFKINLKIQKFTIYSSKDPSEQFLKIHDLLAIGSLRKKILKSVISISEGTFEKKTKFLKSTIYSSEGGSEKKLKNPRFLCQRVLQKKSENPGYLCQWAIKKKALKILDFLPRKSFGKKS